jgi:hypothetical protein
MGSSASIYYVDYIHFEGYGMTKETAISSLEQSPFQSGFWIIKG